MLGLAHRLAAGLASRVRNARLRALGTRLTGYVWLRRVSVPRNWSDITIEAGAGLDDGVVLLSSGERRPDKIVIGGGTYVNRHTMLDAHEKVAIGRDCLIGPYVYITDANHGMVAGRAPKDQPSQARPVVIEDEAWLGAHVTVLAGVRIGRGAVIGAGSVVTRDIPAMAIACGVPARVCGERPFDGRLGEAR